MDSKKHKNILLLTCSGGGGHLQAANAKKISTLKENPTVKFIQKDVIVDWVGKHFGEFFISIWNISQKKGNLTVLNLYTRMMRLADIFFWGHIFFHVFFTIIRKDIDHIVDTQPVGTPATIKAIKLARLFTKKPLKLEKIITELPTDKVFQFFKPIKRLSSKDRSLLNVISTAPLTDKDQTADEFWKKNCGLAETDINYENLPLRPAFLKYANKTRSPDQKMEIQIKVKSPQEKHLIANSIKKGNSHAEIYLDRISFVIDPEDKVFTILLGSQPTEEATLKYVKNFITMAKKMPSQKTRHLLFVFCNHFEEHKNCLLRRMQDLIINTEDYPSHLSIIPMCFQEDDVIAPLFYRSDATFTRSGGMTAMELLTVAQGQIWIHSENKHPTNDIKKLSRGMPIWERGNAFYLKARKGAEFITPDIFLKEYSSHFSEENIPIPTECMSF